MEETFKSKVGFWLFLIIVLTLLIGGHIFTTQSLKENKKDKKKEEVVVNYKIDKDKDYIYYDNERVISEDAEIDYKDAVINIKGQESLTKTLQEENESYKTTIKYISKENIMSDELVKYKYDDIYALKFRKYDNFESNKYVSLLITDYDYSCFDLINFNKTKSYVFDITTGELLSEKELLSIYNLSMDDLLDKIKKYLEEKQSKVNGVEVIKIKDTIKKFGNYALYVNNLGKLEISFLVKTTQVDYNEVMEVS